MDCPICKKEMKRQGLFYNCHLCHVEFDCENPYFVIHPGWRGRMSIADLMEKEKQLWDVNYPTGIFGKEMTFEQYVASVLYSRDDAIRV